MIGSYPLPPGQAEDVGPWGILKSQLPKRPVIILPRVGNGMACPAIKNFFLYCDQGAMVTNLPCLRYLNPVSAALIRQAELRASTKECRPLLYPETDRAQNVEKVLNHSRTRFRRLTVHPPPMDYNLEALLALRTPPSRCATRSTCPIRTSPNCC